MTTDFILTLKSIVGANRVLTSTDATRPYRTGFRCGEGRALAVVLPRTLLEQWRVLQACVTANKIIIMQAANTGLTGGSTPDGDNYDRDVVIVNTTDIAGIHVIDGGRQVICLPGATLHQLEKALEPYGREPHSTIGSSCIGASVLGGICNNSGGSLVRRGPAYTQLALFAQLDANGHVQLVNHLGVDLGSPLHSVKRSGEAERMLGRLEQGAFSSVHIEHSPHSWASDRDYTRRIRQIDSDIPIRFNADPHRLFEASGSAGKIAIFAVRLDTFPKDKQTQTFYIGTNNPAELTNLRRHILANFEHLPVAGEYIHRDMFHIAAHYGKDSFLLIQCLGTQRLPAFFRLKRDFDRVFSSDRILQTASRLLPNHLPLRMRAFRDRYEHHLILKMADAGIAEARKYLSANFPSATGDYFECTQEDGTKAFLHRFVAAGAAIRYKTIHHAQVEDILALDIALKPNDLDWFETLPDDIRDQIQHALYYGHFFCRVFHHDYIVRKGVDIDALKQRLLELLDQRRAEYAAEHNVGHQYRAKPALANFYRSLDPCNHSTPASAKPPNSLATGLDVLSYHVLPRFAPVAHSSEAEYPFAAFDCSLSASAPTPNIERETT